MQREKRTPEGISRFAEKENVIKYFLIWLTDTNTYLPTMGENHTCLAHIPRSKIQQLKKVMIRRKCILKFCDCM